MLWKGDLSVAKKQLSSVPPEVDPGGLMAGSRGVLGFWMVHLLRRPKMLRDAIDELFGV